MKMEVAIAQYTNCPITHTVLLVLTRYIGVNDERNGISEKRIIRNIVDNRMAFELLNVQINVSVTCSDESLISAKLINFVVNKKHSIKDKANVIITFGFFNQPLKLLIAIVNT